MTDKQRQKHIKDAVDVTFTPEGSSLDAAEPTPDGLGEWQGGTAVLKCANNDWVSRKSRANALAEQKHVTGTEYATKITHRQDQDFNEIHTDANDDLWLYNVTTDAWDIKSDAQTIPFYEDENGNFFAYNYHTGAWDVPTEDVYMRDLVE